jgi:hypothetical protein
MATEKGPENPAFGQQATGEGGIGGLPADDAAVVASDIEMTLKGGTITAEEAIVLMVEQKMEQMEQKMEQMEQQMGQMKTELTARFASQSAPAAGSAAADAARYAIARLASAPCNWHQATVFYASSTDEQDAASNNKAMAPLMLAAGAAMALGQSLAVVAVMVGIVTPACASSDMCTSGRYCTIGAEFPRCKYCGGDTPFENVQVSSAPGTCLFEPDPSPIDANRESSVLNPACQTLNLVYDPNFVGYNTTLSLEMCAEPTARTGLDNLGQTMPLAQSSVAEWCSRCVHPLDGSVDPTESLSLMRMNVDSMGTFDLVALAFASCVIAFKLVGELQDIHMCELAIARAGNNLSVGWRVALRLIVVVRRWAFLGFLVVAVAWMIILKGGDALSVCCEPTCATPP